MMSLADLSMDPDNEDLTKTSGSFYTSLDSVKTQIKNFSCDVESIKTAVALKANSKDVATVIEKKANFDEVFKVFSEMKKSIEILRSKQESLESSKSLTDMLADQRLLNTGFTRISMEKEQSITDQYANQTNKTLIQNLIQEQALSCQQSTVF